MTQPFKVETEDGRVFFTIGNYEFEIVVPPILTENGVDVESTAELLRRQLTELVHDRHVGDRRTVD